MNAQVSKPLADKAQAAALKERLRGLTPAQAVLMREVMRLHAAGDLLMSAQWLLQLAAQAPAHPEVLLWQGRRHSDARDWPQAADCLARAAAARPDDFTTWWLLGTAQGQVGDAAAARHSLQQAAGVARSAAQWLQLSIACDQQGLYDEALQAVQAALRQEPGSPVARLQRSRCHKALGGSRAAADDCRWLIDRGQEVARAWFSLVDLKTVSLSEAERQRLAATAQRPGLPAAEKELLDFALGKALEDAGDLDGALAVFQRANAAVRARLPWDAAGFGRRMAAVREAFATAAPQAAPQGREVIFIVGLPRSGSTLVEQVLASHPAVEGASELPTLPQVIEEESRRCGRPFPAWVGEASAADWTRLGQRYLQLSARWRLQRAVSTDKLPDNWTLLGAVRAMLPEARIIDCRRDALETCWSCYKQLFGPGMAAYSYDFDSLARYAVACERSGDAWQTRDPAHVRVQPYEALVADPEGQTRALLDFCGLPFDPACLSAHTAQRAIRTPSALQVRQPMQRVSSPAAGYGDRLAPLREALAAARALPQA